MVTWYWSLQLQTAQTAHVLAASRLSSETWNRSARWIIRGQRKHSDSVTFYPIYSDLFSTLSEHTRTLNWYDLMASDSAWSSGSTDLHTNVSWRQCASNAQRLERKIPRWDRSQCQPGPERAWLSIVIQEESTGCAGLHGWGRIAVLWFSVCTTAGRLQDASDCSYLFILSPFSLLEAGFSSWCRGFIHECWERDHLPYLHPEQPSSSLLAPCKMNRNHSGQAGGASPTYSISSLGAGTWGVDNTTTARPSRWEFHTGLKLRSYSNHDH